MHKHAALKFHSHNTVDFFGCDSVFRPHGTTTYVDAAYCYRSSSVVVSPAKMTEVIEMTFGLRTRVGQRNYVLDRVQIPHVKRQLPEERICPGMPDSLP